MKRKKIGVIIGSVTHFFASRVCSTISRKAEEYGYDVYFFTTFNSHGDNLLYGVGEQQIFSLADYSQFDGVIFALDTLNISDRGEALVKKLKGLSCPVVSLREPVEGFYNIRVDETVSMERMIRHFIEVHKFRDICFMTGRMELEDARLRFECFKRVMEEAGIPVTDDMVYYGDYWKTFAKPAVDHFLSTRTTMYPQAIICANDYMALAVLRELNERGIRVPEEVCVSGFDDLMEAQHAEPPLTTVSVNFEEMAERAVDLIDEIAHGMKPEKNQYISTQDKYRGSCGCKRHKVTNKWYSLTKELEERKEINYQTIFMNSDLEGITDESELLNVVHKYNLRNNAKKMWICLCDESEELTEEERNLGTTRLEYTKSMILRSIKNPSNTLRLLEKKFDRSELVPEDERQEIENGSFYFVPLHYKNHNLGYVAATFDNYGHYNDFMQPWAMNFAVALENYFLHERLDAMNDIKRMYKEDTLTGICNRRGFEEKARKIYNDSMYMRKRIAVISIDMDNLKKINDAYGHSAGDDALCRVGTALTRVSERRDNIVVARTGGDEFVVVCRMEQPSDGEDIIKEVREELVQINEQNGQPYSAEVSCGLYEVKDASKTALAKALEISDSRMYENKRQRKAQKQE
ncbi:MAG: GGDEF domain-containing protein [Lachnospiraceae bacterium]|nr:GGDEF domain-containing protein [Lachnospiraceae bacterium]